VTKREQENGSDVRQVSMVPLFLAPLSAYPLIYPVGPPP
jgi:hypothetical protein